MKTNLFCQVPTGKQLTKWEEYAKTKSIKKKKKDSKVWDEQTKVINGEIKAEMYLQPTFLTLCT